MPSPLEEARELAIYWQSECAKASREAIELRVERDNLRNRLNSGVEILGQVDVRVEDLLNEIHRLRVRRDQLEAVCQFYADDENWVGGPAAIVDNGMKAKVVLDITQEAAQ